VYTEGRNYFKMVKRGISLNKAAPFLIEAKRNVVKMCNDREDFSVLSQFRIVGIRGAVVIPN